MTTTHGSPLIELHRCGYCGHGQNMPLDDLVEYLPPLYRAAPELLEALRIALAEIEHLDPYQRTGRQHLLPAVIQARAAIEKAEKGGNT